MKKTFILVPALVLLLSACGGGEKVYIDGENADGFTVEGAATPTPVPTLAPDERDFRGMKWGMSLSDITGIEGEGYTTIKEGVIRYRGLLVGGFPVESEYTLENGKLAVCIYYTTHTHDDTNEFISDYNMLLERYTKKYGKPIYSEQKWSDGAESHNPSEFAKAIEDGIMMYRSGWEVRNTRINLVLFKDTDTKIKIGIRYQAIDVDAAQDVAPEGDIEI